MLSEVLRRLVGSGRSRWLRVAVALGLPMALTVPGQASASKSAAGRVSVTKACTYAFKDPTGDGFGLTGQKVSQLDLVKGTLGLTRDHKKLRVVLNIQNLSKKVPTGSNFNDYDFYWTNPAGDSGPNAVEAQVNSSGKVTYSDGTESTIQGNFNYTPSSTSKATGKFGSGRNGAIEVDVPLSEMRLKLGKVLGKPAAYSATGVNGQVTSLGSIADQAGPGRSYKLGQSTCIDPERKKRP